MMQDTAPEKEELEIPSIKQAMVCECDDDASGNASTNAVMAIGDVFEGEISSGSDRDWIEVTLEQGETYTFTMWGTNGNSGLSDTVLEIYNSSGSSVASNDDLSSTLRFSGVQYTATQSGTYYIEAGSYGTGTGSYRVQAATDVFTPDQIATYLTEIDWNFRTPIRLDAQAGGTLTYNVSGLTNEGVQLAEWALESWSSALGISFVQSSSSAADILFDDNQNGAFAGPSQINTATGVSSQSTVNVGTSWLAQYGSTIDSYSFTTYLHEIGHALGLGHAGPYDGQATYGTDNLYANDSNQLSIMSYFDPSDNSAVTGTDVSFISPMAADLIAVERLYGAAQTYQGDTVWGANSNVGGWLGQLFGMVYDGDTIDADFYDGGRIGFIIHDTGGTDTLDLSTYSASQRIDLREGRFSDTFGLTANLTISAGTIVEDVVSGNGNDSIQGNSADNRITAGRGNDTVNGADGTDTAVLNINRSEVVVSVSGTSTIIESWQGTDSYRNVEFFQFNDELVSVSNLQSGTDGGDTGGGGTGGGTGGGDTGEALDLVGTDGADLLTGGGQNDTLAGGAGDDTLQGGGGDDQIAASAGNDRVEGGSGNDNIGGGTGNDTIEGGDGNDTVGAGQGNDVINGGAGNDGLFGGAGVDVINGGIGNDNIGAGFANDTLNGGDGNDNMGGGTGRDVITGGAGNDTIGGGEGDDNIEGGSGNDFLAGGGRNDVINGGSGGDRINGGLGNDTMTGGTGADTFIFAEYGEGETDIITDFENGTDMLRFTGVDKVPGSGLQGFVDALNVTAVSGGVELSYDGNTVVLQGVSVSQIGTEDFIFV